MQPSLFRNSLLSFAWLALACSMAVCAQQRPKITGISHITVYTSDSAASERFYSNELGAAKEQDQENPRGVVYRLSATQFIEVLPLPEAQGLSRLDHIAFRTDDAAALRRYLLARGVKPVGPMVHSADGSPSFYVTDPEGNKVELVQVTHQQTDTQQGHPKKMSASVGLLSPRIIHVGFLVKDRAREDGFYRSLLGFRPYWYGGMHPDKLDWVSEQVPDGHDWLEYMMTGPGSDSPDAAQVSARQLGVMNHLSLGVPNMEKAVTTLYARDVLQYSPRHDGPQMGKDGKWQANLYDPDGTRVELMEFQPVIEPCCSPFTAASPAE